MDPNECEIVNSHLSGLNKDILGCNMSLRANSMCISVLIELDMKPNESTLL